MDAKRKAQILSALNGNTVRTENDNLSIGLDYCNIRCLRTKDTPGWRLSKMI